jgi:hypothetical protein
MGANKCNISHIQVIGHNRTFNLNSSWSSSTFCQINQIQIFDWEFFIFYIVSYFYFKKMASNECEKFHSIWVEKINSTKLKEYKQRSIILYIFIWQIQLSDNSTNYENIDKIFFKLPNYISEHILHIYYIFTCIQFCSFMSIY